MVPDSASSDPQVVGTGGARAGQGHNLGTLRHLVYGFTGTNTVATGDTFVKTGENVIVRAAWEPVDDGDEAAAEVQTGGLVVTMTTSIATVNGYLHLWVTG